MGGLVCVASKGLAGGVFGSVAMIGLSGRFLGSVARKGVSGVLGEDKALVGREERYRAAGAHGVVSGARPEPCPNTRTIILYGYVFSRAL